MIAEEHHHEDERHQPAAEPDRGGAQRAENAECESGEVVRHLVLIELRRPQADDGQHAEQRQPQPEPGTDVAGAQRARHREDADVDPQVGDDQVAPAVPGK